MLFDRLLRVLGFGPPIIEVYHCYRSADSIILRGRVLRDDYVSWKGARWWLPNFYKAIKKFVSLETGRASLRLTGLDGVHEFVADREGYFKYGTSYLESEDPALFIVLIGADCKVVGGPLPLLCMSKRASPRFGIISDIDDTILVTGVISRLKWRLILNTLFVHPFKRKTFPNTSALYRSLERGKNPIFYISNSPWNMHAYLQAYLEFQEFPSGVILLRDIDFLKWKSKELELQNKFQEILNVLDTHRNLTFVLIGDAGEVDVDIYERIAKTHPNQVKAIYIRSVRDKKRMKRVREFEDRGATVPIIVFDHSHEMASHALSIGLTV